MQRPIFNTAVVYETALSSVQHRKTSNSYLNYIQFERPSVYARRLSDAEVAVYFREIISL